MAQGDVPSRPGKALLCLCVRTTVLTSSERCPTAPAERCLVDARREYCSDVVDEHCEYYAAMARTSASGGGRRELPDFVLRDEGQSTEGRVALGERSLRTDLWFARLGCVQRAVKLYYR